MTLTPLAYVMISAAMRGMNPALVEAASVHGVSKWRTLVRIELPLIWPALFSAIIWMLTVAIAAFDVPGVIGMANNIFTFSTAIYFMINPNEGLPRYGLSGAYGTIMVGVSLILMIPYFIALKQSHKYQIISGKSYQSRPVELGRWWLLALGFAGRVFFARFCLALAGDFLGVVAALRAGAVAPSAVGHLLRTLHPDRRSMARSWVRRWQYGAAHGAGSDDHRGLLLGDLVDRDALAPALARRARRHRLSAPSGAESSCSLWPSPIWRCWFPT